MISLQELLTLLSYSSELSHLFTIYLQATELKEWKQGEASQTQKQQIHSQQVPFQMFGKEFLCLDGRTAAKKHPKFGHVMERCTENAKSIGIYRGKKDQGAPFGTSGVFWMQCAS